MRERERDGDGSKAVPAILNQSNVFISEHFFELKYSLIVWRMNRDTKCRAGGPASNFDTRVHFIFLHLLQ